jgi:predicted DNA-binding protein
VSLTGEQYEHLAAIAAKNHVSIAWVVRESIERSLKDDMPLFHILDFSS